MSYFKRLTVRTANVVIIISDDFYLNADIFASKFVTINCNILFCKIRINIMIYLMILNTTNNMINYLWILDI